jgi:hypothetical protein
MTFTPEFYALCTAYWQVYQPIIFIWLVLISALSLLIAVGLFALLALRPLFLRWR